MCKDSAWPTFRPYSVKPLRTIRGWFTRTEFGIFFEDNMIRESTLSYEETNDIVFLLNVAYSNGAMNHG